MCIQVKHPTLNKVRHQYGTIPLDFSNVYTSHMYYIFIWFEYTM